jgi:hypothetical protein
MIAEQDKELHLMAKRIGLERRKYQGDHYDLPTAARALAVKYGAVQITMRQLASLVFLHRAGQLMGDPDTAVERMRAWKRLINAGRARTEGSRPIGTVKPSTSAESQR